MKTKETCCLIQDLLPSYLDDVTSEASNKLIQQHLQECNDCRRVYDAMNGPASPAQLHAEELVNTMIWQRKRERRGILLTILGLLLAAAVCLLPLPRPIHQTYEALHWCCDDTAFQRRHTLTMDGVYFDYLFKTDYFDGSITIDDYFQTFRPLTRVWFHDGIGTLFYMTEEGMLDDFGWIVLQPSGQAFTIGMYNEKGWSGDTGRMFTSPAADRSAAVALSNTLCSQYSPAFLRDWRFK